MGTVSPNGVGNAAFTEGVLQGRSGVRRISRFDPSEISVQIAGEVRDFDELAWVEKRERKHVSRVLPLALAAATEALRDAGIDSASLPLEQRRRFGVILGSGGGSQEFTEEQYRLFFHQQYKQMSLFCVPTGVMGTLSSELSVRFGLRGPSHVVTTGCTSSTDAFGYSLRQIQSGRLDMALSGGADAPIALGIVKGFLLMKILTDSWNQAPEKGSRPFSVDRDGFVLGEGAGVLVLEELEHARQRDATIYAEVLGFGSSFDAYGVTKPDPEARGAARAIEWALKEARVDHRDIDYINAHGTSTRLNDQMETVAVKRVFGEGSRALPLSSIKSMVGHLIGAAGAVEAAALALTLKDGVLPPTINLTQRDPECDLDYVPNTARDYPIRTAMSTSFGFGGQNAALVMRRLAS